MLHVEHECYGVGVDINRLPQFYDSIPGATKYTIRADSSRPETISYMQQHGYPRVIGCAKWPNCAEDGVAHMRSYEKIVVHPRCTHTAEEMRLYSYKVDRLSGDVLSDLVDKHNHPIDASRYPPAPLIQRRLGTL